MSEEEKIEVVEEQKEEAVADVMAATVHSDDDPVVSGKTLLDAGCHFGHRVSQWNPKMRQYIYNRRNNLHIIDMNKTAQCMQNAYKALKDIVSKGGKVLFVGTKNYAQKAIQEEAVRSGSFYVSHRWLGGTLTNFRTICKRISLLKEIEQREITGEIEKLPKKEAAEILKLKEKLNANLEGIKEIRLLPQALVVVDPKAEHNAVAEARILNIPVFALGDTNTNPDEVDYLVPANDGGEASIRIIVGLFADAVVEGKGGEPLYAYKNTTDASATMADMLKAVDPNEQIKAIRSKLRDDAIAMRKASRKGVRRKPVKNNRRFQRPRPNTNKDQNAAPTAENTAEKAPEQNAAPANTAAAVENKTEENN